MTLNIDITLMVVNEESHSRREQKYLSRSKLFLPSGESGGSSVYYFQTVGSELSSKYLSIIF